MVEDQQQKKKDTIVGVLEILGTIFKGIMGVLGTILTGV